MARRTLAEEMRYLTLAAEGQVRNLIHREFAPNMRVPGVFFANDVIRQALLDELKSQSEGRRGGFLPAIRQIANVASLPGIVGHSIGLPDCHAGYGFAIGNVAAMDMSDPEAVVSPGGVGFDICCGVRLIRTDLTVEDILPLKEKLVQRIMDLVPTGVGGKGPMTLCNMEFDEVLETGMAWSVKQGHATEEDRDHIEERGCIAGANACNVSKRAKERGRSHIGTLGAGNHYIEVQRVDQIFDHEVAETMRIGNLGQICIMIHTGSRGLGHQVCTDALETMKTVKRDYALNDKQLMCAPIRSKVGQEYLSALACASNFAFVNRSAITSMVRRAFASIFNRSPDDLGMHVVYDVAHNTAKVEAHEVEGKQKKLLVHRKGATRAFPPRHPDIPERYQAVGQPVLVGGSMGTASHVLVGTEAGMSATFGSTCHGAGRLISRQSARNTIRPKDTLARLKDYGVSIRVGNPKLLQEEDSQSYKDVDEVVATCESAQISNQSRVHPSPLSMMPVLTSSAVTRRPRRRFARMVSTSTMKGLHGTLDGQQFEYLPHTADVQFHAWGSSLKELFEQMGYCMFHYLTDLTTVDIDDSYDWLLEVTGDDDEDALYKFLDELLFQFNTGNEIVARQIHVLDIEHTDQKRQNTTVRAIVKGEPFNRSKHPLGTDIKAITYEELRIYTSTDGCQYDAYVIVDI
ncbi:RNA-splicing ligase RtcB like protein [Plasmodiophora brassicae]